MNNALSLSLDLIDTVLIAVMLGVLLKTERGQDDGRLPGKPETPTEAGSESPSKHARFARIAQFDVLTSMGLTPQEIRVAKLIMDGKSYREISLEMGLSVRTVQHHARRAIAKTGAASRKDFEKAVRQAAAQMVDDGETEAPASPNTGDGRMQARCRTDEEELVRARR